MQILLGVSSGVHFLLIYKISKFMIIGPEMAVQFSKLTLTQLLVLTTIPYHIYLVGHTYDESYSLNGTTTGFLEKEINFLLSSSSVINSRIFVSAQHVPMAWRMAVGGGHRVLHQSRWNHEYRGFPTSSDLPCPTRLGQYLSQPDIWDTIDTCKYLIDF